MVIYTSKDRSDHRKLILLDLMLVYGYMYRSKDVPSIDLMYGNSDLIVV